MICISWLTLILTIVGLLVLANVVLLRAAWRIAKR